MGPFPEGCSQHRNATSAPVSHPDEYPHWQLFVVRAVPEKELWIPAHLEVITGKG